MASRGNKSKVGAEQRQEWLERYQGGESPPRIAKADGVDARTVRKHINAAMQDRESKDARASVLRNALERHYAELCRCAERLAAPATPARLSIDQLPSTDDKASPYQSYLEAALRQHIPSSPIWRWLAQERKLGTAIEELTKTLNDKIDAGVSSDPRLASQLAPEEDGVIPGIVAALIRQAPFWLSGPGTLNARDHLKYEPDEAGRWHAEIRRFRHGEGQRDGDRGRTGCD